MKLDPAAIMASLYDARTALCRLPSTDARAATMAALCALVTAHGMRVAVVAHRRLVRVAADLVGAGLPLARVGIARKSDKQWWDEKAPVQVVSDWSFGWRKDAPPASLVIFDEAERTGDAMYAAVRAAYPKARVLGFTTKRGGDFRTLFGGASERRKPIAIGPPRAAVGKTHGLWTVLEYVEGLGHRDLCVRVRCKCGTEKVVNTSNWKASKSCGCAPHEPTSGTVVGRRFGILTATGKQQPNNEIAVACDCGNKLVAKAANLYTGKQKSCGSCLPSPHKTHGLAQTRAYQCHRRLLKMGAMCAGLSMPEAFVALLGQPRAGMQIGRAGKVTCGACAECLTAGATRHGEWVLNPYYAGIHAPKSDPLLDSLMRAA